MHGENEHSLDRSIGHCEKRPFSYNVPGNGNRETLEKIRKSPWLLDLRIHRHWRLGSRLTPPAQQLHDAALDLTPAGNAGHPSPAQRRRGGNMERRRRNFSPLPDMGPHVAILIAWGKLTQHPRCPLTEHPTTAPRVAIGDPRGGTPGSGSPEGVRSPPLENHENKRDKALARNFCASAPGWCNWLAKRPIDGHPPRTW